MTEHKSRIAERFARVDRAGISQCRVQRLRPKLMTVTAVILSLATILWESGIGSDVMKPIAAPIVGGMITPTIHVLILVPVFFFLLKKRALVGRSRLNAEFLAASHCATHEMSV